MPGPEISGVVRAKALWWEGVRCVGKQRGGQRELKLGKWDMSAERWAVARARWLPLPCGELRLYSKRGCPRLF